MACMFWYCETVDLISIVKHINVELVYINVYNTNKEEHSNNFWSHLLVLLYFSMLSFQWINMEDYSTREFRVEDNYERIVSYPSRKLFLHRYVSWSFKRHDVSWTLVGVLCPWINLWSIIYLIKHHVSWITLLNIMSFEYVFLKRHNSRSLFIHHD